MSEKTNLPTIYTLFSGSKGNCAYIKYSDTEILIDAGMGVRSIGCALKSVGSSLENISDIFITHDHSDHTRGLEAICSKFSPRVHITARSAEVIINSLTPNLKEAACIHPTEYTEKVGDIEISSFQTPHDSKASVGYILKMPYHTVGYATDIGHISETVKKALTGVDSVILEANHDVDMLLDGNYPEFLKERILSKKGHLSNDSAAELAAYLAENGTKSFLLAHLSEQNNDPEIAFGAVFCALSNPVSRGISLAVAEPSTPTRLL